MVVVSITTAGWQFLRGDEMNHCANSLVLERPIGVRRPVICATPDLVVAGDVGAVGALGRGCGVAVAWWAP